MIAKALMQARFTSDPKTVLSEHGINVPEHMNVNVLENSHNTMHLTMPKAPDGSTELSDEEMAGAAGGTYTFSDCASPAHLGSNGCP